MLNSGAGETAYEFRAADKGDVSRRQLADAPPDHALRLSDRATLELSEWTARRYTRTALPDEFVKRFGEKRRDKLRNLQKKYPDEVQGVYVALSTWGEVGAMVPYRIQLQIVITEEAWSDPSRRTEIEREFYDPVVAVFKGAHGIDVEPDGCQLTATHLFPISEFDAFVPLDLDLDLSYAEDPPAGVPVRSALGP
jgi:hypothetical protein